MIGSSFNLVLIIKFHCCFVGGQSEEEDNWHIWLGAGGYLYLPGEYLREHEATCSCH